MHVDILTIFPRMFDGPFSESIVNRAQKQGAVTIKIHDLRDFASDDRRSVDDRPYGGGPGMVMLIEPIDKAIKTLKRPSAQAVNSKVILTSAKGTPFNQAKANQLSHIDHLIFIAGHYEGVDQRVADHLVDEEISLGNFVVTGGELPVMVMVDSIVRLLPGVLGDPDSLTEESHSSPGYLEYPHYTRPGSYHGWSVPEVLLSGHHAAIKKWREKNSKES